MTSSSPTEAVTGVTEGYKPVFAYLLWQPIPGPFTGGLQERSNCQLSHETAMAFRGTAANS